MKGDRIERCHRCEGTGLIPEKWSDNAFPLSRETLYNRIKCPNCEGTGFNNICQNKHGGSLYNLYVSLYGDIEE